ncbi:uncharacterized protein LOC143918119 [Arctopsyche grandis]|uniref:uncharacterized protein LOC143918119 n=1 Tax=Arctopsyche grandis TaxID=121162 RepID=UPI00406D7BBD
MIRRGSFILVTLLLAYNIKEANSQLEAIRDFIQINIAGVPVLHQQSQWEFDPDISLKRRALWEEVNGIKGEKLIDRLGLGMDGKEAERREQHRIKDNGHLGGLNYFQP